MNIEYLLIGGYAMGAYGLIRATSNLDIFLNYTKENADKMIAACEKYGIPAEDLNRDMFLVPRMIGIGEPPLRKEILKQLGAVDFSYEHQRATTKEVNGLKIEVFSR